MTLWQRIYRGDFNPGVTIVPERIRRARLSRYEEGGYVPEWIYRALTNRLPAQVGIA